VDYATLRARHIERALSIAPAHVERVHWPRTSILRERRRAFGALLAFAARLSRWHREPLAHVRASGSSEEALLARIRQMTKGDLMSNFDAIVTEPRLTFSRVQRQLETLETDAYLLNRSSRPRTTSTSRCSAGRRTGRGRTREWMRSSPRRTWSSAFRPPSTGDAIR